MTNRIAAALAEKLGAHVPLGKSRLETLCLLVVGMIGARTVNLAHVATERGGRSGRPRPTAGCSASSSRSGSGRTGRCRCWPR